MAPTRVDRRTALRMGVLAGCGLAATSCGAATEWAGSGAPSPVATAPATATRQTRPAASGSAAASGEAPSAPELPAVGPIANGQPLGAGILTYDLAAPRDWSDIDRWYRSTGRVRPQFTGEPRVHRLIAGNRSSAPPRLALDPLLLRGMVLENDPISPPGVHVIAHHNVTRIRDGGVRIGPTVYREPLMGIHAPEVPGDLFTWLWPSVGRTAEWTYRAVSVELIPDRAGEYEKLFTPLPDGTPLLVTYQCHPAGSLAQRRVVRHELVSAEWSDRDVQYV